MTVKGVFSMCRRRWVGFVALGVACAALLAGLWRRSDRGGTPPEQARPVDTAS